MNINVTLVFQIINFLIAYFILERYFFRPLVQKIEDEECEIEKVQNSIDCQKKELEVLDSHAKEQWNMHQRRLRREVPKPERAKAACLFTKSKPIKKSSEKEKDLAEKIIQELKDSIVNA